MIYFRRLKEAYLYFYIVILSLAVIACVLYTLISTYVQHSALVVTCFNVGTIVTAAVWTILAALALLLCSKTLHSVCSVLGYLYSAVLLCLLVAGYSHRKAQPTAPEHLAYRIAFAAVVVISWIINFILTNWAMKLRRELEFEGLLLHTSTHIEILSERIEHTPAKKPPTAVKKPPEEAPAPGKKPLEQAPPSATDLG